MVLWTLLKSIAIRSSSDRASSQIYLRDSAGRNLAAEWHMACFSQPHIFIGCNLQPATAPRARHDCTRVRPNWSMWQVWLCRYMSIGCTVWEIGQNRCSRLRTPECSSRGYPRGMRTFEQLNTTLHTHVVITNILENNTSLDEFYMLFFSCKWQVVSLD